MSGTFTIRACAGTGCRYIANLSLFSANFMSLTSALLAFDPDTTGCPVAALHVQQHEHEREGPLHRHEKGQLVIALHGAVTCRVPDAVWLVPASHAVWIPGSVAHSNRATPNARLCLLFIDPAFAPLPDRCCTLAITPLVREIVLHLADQPQQYTAHSTTGRLVDVLLELLRYPPDHPLRLPMPEDSRIRKITDSLIATPSDRSTLARWAERVAMSERSLSRLMLKQTGLSFVKWRQQLHLVIALHQLSAGASVQQVASELGYASTTAFITMFKQTFGAPPARYLGALRRHGEG